MDVDASPKKKIQINKLNSGWIDNSSHGSIPVENNMEQSIAGTKTTVLSQNNATRSFPVIVIPPSTEEVTTSDESSSSDSGIPPKPGPLLQDECNMVEISKPSNIADDNVELKLPPISPQRTFPPKLKHTKPT